MELVTFVDSELFEVSNIIFKFKKIVSLRKIFVEIKFKAQSFFIRAIVSLLLVLLFLKFIPFNRYPAKF